LHTAKDKVRARKETSEMIRQLIMTAVLIAAVIPALGQEETCPNPVPDQPTRSQVVACLRNIQSLSGDNIIRAKDLQRPSAEKAFENLRNNTRVNWLIRLITYDPNSLRLSGLTTLGKQTDRFSFVAPYEELRGLPVNTAVTKLGGEVDPKNGVFASYFRRRHNPSAFFILQMREGCFK
jgi:hypothetical protein